MFEASIAHAYEEFLAVVAVESDARDFRICGVLSHEVYPNLVLFGVSRVCATECSCGDCPAVASENVGKLFGVGHVTICLLVVACVVVT